MMKTVLAVFVVCLLLLGCQTSPVGQNKQTTELARAILAYEKYVEQQSPFNRDVAGEANAQLPNLSAEYLAQKHQDLNKIFAQIQRIDIEHFTTKDAINYSVLRYTIENQLDSYINKEHYLPLTAESGFHVWISRINARSGFKTEQDYRDYFSRLKALPRYFSEQMAWMDKGIAAGITQPKVVLQGFEASIKAFIKADVTESVYYQPLLSLPEHFSAALIEQLQQQAITILKKDVMTSYQQYLRYMVERYQPNARENIAASSLPNGSHYYQNRLQHYTTLALSADDIHQIGLQEVARIRSEMQNIINHVGFDGSFRDFVHFLRTDRQFYATSAEELLKEAAYIAKKMDAQLPKLFKTLPRTPYGVIAVPANIAPKYTTGRYSAPARDDQPGNYWVNTYRLDRRPLYVLEALTLHEAVPGHHLQGSIAREMQEVPKFRNNTYISAFGEGWGLYAEYLGLEAGFYQNPYSDFGRLTYEMWRACRLVVDTGMHTKGWSREKAINYLADNTALSLHNVKTEIDRYISWPAQALSYKMGELTIKKIRRDAELALGASFDLRDFHDHILRNGSMPLPILEKLMTDYIAERKTVR